MATRIAIVGGLQRQERELARLAEAAGYELLVHSGEMGGRGAAGLRALVAQSDIVVIITGVNSHTAVQLAKKLSRQLGRTSVVHQRFSAARFRALLDALTIHESHARWAGDGGAHAIAVGG